MASNSGFSSEVGRTLIQLSQESVSNLTLEQGSRVAVIGGGPAGSFFSFFLLKLAETIGIDLEVDILEPRQFSTFSGPAGCNHCGGIVSESLVQMLATEGINIPSTVIQRGIESYVLHMDVGDVRIETPLHEKRIAAVYRGKGPKDIQNSKWSSFDQNTLKMAEDRGAQVRRQLVSDISWESGRPTLSGPKGEIGSYDLLVVASGVNSQLQYVLEQSGCGYIAPERVKTFICEYHLGEEQVALNFGNAMHVFLLDLPHLEFAAVIPKGDYVTLCMLGDEINEELVSSFLNAPEVQACFPPDFDLYQSSCLCFPTINVGGTGQPFGDRLLVIGDSGVTRLYKDGIGAAYKTAKAAATAAVFQGISKEDFKRSFWPACRKIEIDNSIGKFVFAVNKQLQRTKVTRRTMLRMTRMEQTEGGPTQQMSTVLWDIFTGSAPYKEILLRTMKPWFLARLAWNFVMGGLFFDLKNQDTGAMDGHERLGESLPG
ncbi:MAG: hypothetical protein JSU96_02915 [Acidobacteriota bacterium]|nr:MAG: hypothetical protein JSU96_02915 [Acidobacteriota bacterium]